MTQNPKTNNRQKTGIIPGKRRGGQPGNRNARKPVPTLSLLATRLRDIRRRLRAALKGTLP